MATTIGDNAVVIDFDDDFIRAGYAVPEREPGVLQPALVRPAGSGAGGETVRPIRDRRVEDLCRGWGAGAKRQHRRHRWAAPRPRSCTSQPSYRH